MAFFNYNIKSEPFLIFKFTMITKVVLKYKRVNSAIIKDVVSL